MENKTHYASLDSMQFICAILVVLIHVGTLTDNPFLHFLIKSMICRIAVPLFFIASAFFYRKKSNLSPTYKRTWTINFIKKYLFLSIIYIIPVK